MHIFDLHTAYLAATNVLLPYTPGEPRKKPRKRCPTPAASTALKVGRTSTSQALRRRSAPGGGANTAAR